MPKHCHLTYILLQMLFMWRKQTKSLFQTPQIPKQARIHMEESSSYLKLWVLVLSSCRHGLNAGLIIENDSLCGEKFELVFLAIKLGGAGRKIEEENVKGVGHAKEKERDEREFDVFWHLGDVALSKWSTCRALDRASWLLASGWSLLLNFASYFFDLSALFYV